MNSKVFNFKYKYLYILLTAILVFSDPRVFLRTFFDESTSLYIGILFSVSFLILSLYYLYDAGKFNKYGLLLLCFGSYSIIRFLISGGNWKFYLNYFIVYFLAFLISSVGQDIRFVKAILYSFIIAMLLHTWAIYFPPEFVRVGIDAQTVYGVSRYFDESSIFLGRWTGFNYAPGFLSLLSSVGFVVGIQMVVRKNYFPWIILFITSILCGFACGNRSFLVAFGFSVLFILLVNIWRVKYAYVPLTLIVIFSVLLVNYIWNNTVYGELMYDRFFSDVFFKDVDDRIYGNMGVYDILNVMVENPLFGSLRSIPGTDSLAIFYGDEWFQPHNAFVWIVGSRGLIPALVFVILTIYSMKNYISNIYMNAGCKYNNIALISSLFLGFLIGHIVSVTDVMLENGVMLSLLSYGFAIDDKRSNLILL